MNLNCDQLRSRSSRSHNFNIIYNIRSIKKKKTDYLTITKSFEKNLIILMNKKQKKEFHPAFFKNTLQINIGQNKISRKDVEESLKLVVDLKQIGNICQYKSRNFWYIAFVDLCNSKNLIDKEIIIKNIKFTFEQTIKQSISNVLKFLCFHQNLIK